MLERTRLALNGNLTLANLFENLAVLHGPLRALPLPDGRYHNLTDNPLTYRQCLRFTNLAAEALIRDLDLKKGERVLVATPDRGESLLATAAVVKAGGVAVPEAVVPGASGLGQWLEDCGVTAALVDAAAWKERGLPSRAGGHPLRVMLLGPPDGMPGGCAVLEESMRTCDSHFIPYTLKPGNIAAIFRVSGIASGSREKRDLAMMVTQRGLMQTARTLLPLLPLRRGEVCLCRLSLNRPSGLFLALLALMAGTELRFVEDAARVAPSSSTTPDHPGCPSAVGPGAGVEEMPETGGDFLMTGACLVSADESGRMTAGKGRGPFLRLSLFTAGERATALRVRLSLRLGGRAVSLPGITVPPNRAAVLREDGGRAREGEEGELAVWGPAVTAGYWNDLGTTLRSWNEGWFRTGMRATAGRGGRPVL